MKSQAEFLRALADGHTLMSADGVYLVELTDEGSVRSIGMPFEDAVAKHKIFEIKPPELRVLGNAFPVPTPYLTAPPDGKYYWALDEDGGPHLYEWEGDGIDFDTLNARVAFKTEEDVVDAAAMRNEIFKLLMKELYK